jgi:peptidoglycan hydrolase-like protein with peptidoglycan-binding domain
MHDYDTDEKPFDEADTERPMLRYQETGDDVTYLQERLAAIGPFDPIKAGDARGHFGRMTARCVRAFQEEKGLNVSGVVGPVTWLHLA